MSHLAIRTLIEDTVKSIDRDILFGYAVASDFNAIGGRENIRVHLDPLKQTIDFTEDSLSFTKTFATSIIFYKLDELDGAEVETAKILDEMDDLSDQFIVLLNRAAIEDDNSDEISNNEVTTNTIELSSVTKDMLRKVTVNFMSGWMIQFKITVPNTFDYCSVYE